jgi:hypothetical protein
MDVYLPGSVAALRKMTSKGSKGFNTTLFPGGPPPQYWEGSNRFNFGDRTRTGALRLIWSNPFGDDQDKVLSVLHHIGMLVVILEIGSVVLGSAPGS